MPPKQQAKPSKADQKKKEKIVEDKTFGLKNKKGAKTQKYIQNIQKNTLGNQAAAAKKDATKKDKAKEKVDELNKIFKPVQPVQKVEAGVNPKSVLCAFFKQNQCTKGDKCKFSHDLSLARKSATRNYYETPNEEDKMEDWDEEKLKEVVEKKHGENDRKMPKTDIICKFFLDALENNKYGWFWECPNGVDKCHYRHVLPVGFVLKRDMKKEKKEEISIEELVERERAALGYDLPKINLASFMAWKKSKIEEKRQKAAAAADRKKADLKAGKTVALSGREMFTLNPEMLSEEQMEDDEAAFDATTREDLEEVEGKEIDLDKLASEAQEVDGTAPVTQRSKTTTEPSAAESEPQAAAVPINEDLFDDLSDEDLDGIEEQVDQLNLNNEE